MENPNKLLLKAGSAAGALAGCWEAAFRARGGELCGRSDAAAGCPGLFSALCHLVCPGALPAAPFAGNLPAGFTADTILY